MEQYNKLIPNIYIPEPSVMTDVLDAININGSIEYIPKIWSDMVLFDHTDRENLLTAILNIMCSNKPEKDDEDLNEKFAKIAWDIWTKIEEQPLERLRRLK